MNDPTTTAVTKNPALEEAEAVVSALRERLESHNNNRKNVQEKLCNACEGLRKEIDSSEEIAISNTEEKYRKVSEALQIVLCVQGEDKSNEDTLRKLEELDENRKVLLEEIEDRHKKDEKTNR